MKKNLMIMASLALFAVACGKKERTCECTSTSTNTYTNSQGVTNTSTDDPETDKTVYKDVKKSDLEVMCADKKYTSSSTSTAADGSKTSYTNETDVKCAIK